MNFNFTEVYYLEMALKCALEKHFSRKSVGYEPEAMEDRKHLMDLLDKVTNLITK